MKKLISVMLALCLVCCVPVLAEGLLPSIDGMFDSIVEMPNMSRAILKAPDSDQMLPDGSRRVTFSGVTNEDYDRFSVYLTEFGCELSEYFMEDGFLVVRLTKQGKPFTFAYDGAAGTAVLTYHEGTRCEEFDLQSEQIYQDALSLIGAGDDEGAAALLSGLPGYRDSDELLRECGERTAGRAELYRRFTPGSTVFFGNYPQRNLVDYEPVEWIVLELDRDNGRALLISRYVLDCVPYNQEPGVVNWENCTLRGWLNHNFLNRAFSTAERRAILLTDVDNDPSQGRYETDAGEDTQDRVFLLSYAEAWRYFPTDYERMVLPTACAMVHDVWTSKVFVLNNRPTCNWWLRSPGKTKTIACLVGEGGRQDNGNVYYPNAGVRPVIWVDLEAGMF